ncbi:hypothetical protein M2436_006344 [Streptomyces sp. HB372]|nr:hypothetical protein [Streptomyces sp. HB372]
MREMGGAGATRGALRGGWYHAGEGRAGRPGTGRHDSGRHGGDGRTPRRSAPATSSGGTRTRPGRGGDQPAQGPHGLPRADAHPAARGARPDDRRHRPAEDRRRAARPGEDVLGGHRLPPRLHHRPAALRQARRPLRPQGRLPVRHRRLHHRLRAGGLVAHHGRADRLPRRPGHRRRRPHDRRPGDHRGHRPGPGARPLHGPHRRGLRPRLGRRPPARRVLHRPRLLALVLLHQRPLRPGHPGRHRRRPQTAQARRPAPARRPGRGAPCRRLHLSGAGHQLGRHRVRLGLDHHPRARGGRGRHDGALRRRRTPGRRTDHSAAAVPRLRLQRHRPGRRGRRHRALRGPPATSPPTSRWSTGPAPPSPGC